MINNSESNELEKKQTKQIYWKRVWIGITVSNGILSIFSLFFSPEFFLPLLVYTIIFGIAFVSAYYIRIKPFKVPNNKLESVRQKKSPSKSIYWKRFWIAIIISYGGSAIFSLFFFQAYFFRTLIYIIIFGIALIIAYYIRIRPSKKINKIIYCFSGVIIIGSGLVLLYGLIGFSKYFVRLGSWYVWLNLVLMGIIFTIGGFIGNYIGKKYDYRLPYSLD